MVVFIEALLPLVLPEEENEALVLLLLVLLVDDDDDDDDDDNVDGNIIPGSPTTTEYTPTPEVGGG